MSKEFRLQDPGEGIHEAEIREVHVKKGDEVVDGDIILTVETDKAAVEVPAPFSGVIEEIRVSAGDIANIGEVVMTYRSAEGGEKAKAKPAEEAESKEAARKDAEAKPAEEAEAAEGKKATRNGPPPTRRKERERKGPVPASPATRRLARELGVDLAAVEPGGPQGRVTADDVRAAAGREGEAAEAEARPAKPERRAPAAEAPPLPDFARWGEVERVPLRSIRRATAKQMALSWAQVPHVMLQEDADITELERWRGEHKAAVEEHGGKLTLTVLVMKALVAALKAYPRFNASLDAGAEEIVLKRYYHIGVAVATEQGLLVPVVRDVDRKSIVELASETAELADKARAGELSREEMHGGTFTITNPGPMGGRILTPIINYPQVAILGLGRADLEAKVKGDADEYQFVPRLMLPLSLAFDHRVNDGADAARFVAHLVDILSDTEAILLKT